MKIVLHIGLAFALLFSLPAYAQSFAQEREYRSNADRTRALIPAIEKSAATPLLAARNTPRIINGSPMDPVRPQTWQFTISLQESGFGHICGGSLVTPTLRVHGGQKFVADWDPTDRTPRMAITAAHCVVDQQGKTIDEAKFTVYSGSVDQSSLDRVRQKVKKIVVHETFNKTGDLENDIAILFLEPSGNPAPSGAHIRTIAMPTASDAQEYQQVTAAVSVNGWGTTENGALSQLLRTTRLPYSEQKVCRDQYASIGWNVADGTLCAGFRSGGFDSCQGDSGGGLYFRSGRNGQQLGEPVLVGVVSWGKGCAEAGFPGVYTDVLRHLSWIERKVIENATHF